MSRKRPSDKPKMGRPRKYGDLTERLVVYVPKSLVEGLRRYAAREEMEGRKRPSASDVVMAAFSAYRPLRDFLAEKGLEKGLDTFRAEK